MEVKLTIDAEKYRKFLKDKPDDLTKALSRAIEQGALLVEREAKKHVAGGYFKHPTGRLMNSITSNIHPLKGEIGPTVNYAVFVHDGTRYIRARPFMKETADEMGDSIEKMLAQVVDGML